MIDAKKTIDDLKLLNTLCHGTVLDDAIALLKVQPQIVRCKDCVKHGSVSCPMCNKYVFTTADNWYCAAGERKEGR